eukprot:scaffold662_cov248-Pinguiococcus_pyrenoidosus.AAC.7
MATSGCCCVQCISTGEIGIKERCEVKLRRRGLETVLWLGARLVAISSRLCVNSWKNAEMGALQG